MNSSSLWKNGFLDGRRKIQQSDWHDQITLCYPYFIFFRVDCSSDLELQAKFTIGEQMTIRHEVSQQEWPSQEALFSKKEYGL